MPKEPTVDCEVVLNAIDMLLHIRDELRDGAYGNNHQVTVIIGDGTILCASHGVDATAKHLTTAYKWLDDQYGVA
jgi:hypothetical protein